MRKPLHKNIYLLLWMLLIYYRSDAVNLLSKNKPAYSSTVVTNNGIMAEPAFGVDGNTTTFFETQDFPGSWFKINLLKICQIKYVVLYNRDDKKGELLGNLTISIGNSIRSMKKCDDFVGPGETGKKYNRSCEGTGKFVLLQQFNSKFFHLGEVEVYGTESELQFPQSDCLNINVDEQIHYEGTLSITENNTKCFEWNKVIAQPAIEYTFLHKSDLKSYKNYCRNPNNLVSPWCFTTIHKNSTQNCWLPLCGNTKHGIWELLSSKKPTTTSSELLSQFSSQNGVDGNLITYFQTNKLKDSWWRVDLMQLCQIKYIFMFNRFYWYGERLAKVYINIGTTTTQMKECKYFEGPGITHTMYNITCEGVGQYVELKQAVNEYFHLAEVEVYGAKSVNGNWTEWSSCESICEKTPYCNKTRSCTNPSPAFGGNNCKGPDNMSEKCPPRNGSWSAWSSCKEICKTDNLCLKQRTCTDPIPLYGGEKCKGSDQIEAKCPPIDGMWAQWHSCGVICLTGVEKCSTNRTCTNPRPKNRGKNCVGKSEKVQKCAERTPLIMFLVIRIGIILLLILIYVAYRFIMYKKEQDAQQTKGGVENGVVATEAVPLVLSPENKEPENQI